MKRVARYASRPETLGEPSDDKRRPMTYAEHGEIISRLWVPGTSILGNERLIVLSMFRPA